MQRVVGKVSSFRMVLQVTLKPKKGSGKLAKSLPDTLEVPAGSHVAYLQEYIATRTNTSASRIRLSVRTEKPSSSSSKSKDRVLQATDLLKEFSESGSVEVYYRDLGPQIAWRTVFLLEYLGPLLIHPIFFKFREQIYGTSEAPNMIQTVVYWCVLLHFLKREFETAFIHKFSLATMPLFNLFKNCAHYWLLSGVLVAYFGYAPKSWWAGSGVSRISEFLFYSGGLVKSHQVMHALPICWLFAEISNFIVHLNLASLRPVGSTERRIPYGYGFSRVSCPNYYFEALGWVILTVISGNWAMGLFAFVGTMQMYFWAVKKHQRYLKEFPDYPKNRKAMIPFIA